MANGRPLRGLITELRSLLVVVEPGEWTTAPNHDHSTRPRSLGISNGAREVVRHGAVRYSDAALIVAMRNALPRMLEALEQRERDELRAEVRRIERELSAVVEPVTDSANRADKRH